MENVNRMKRKNKKTVKHKDASEIKKETSWIDFVICSNQELVVLIDDYTTTQVERYYEIVKKKSDNRNEIGALNRLIYIFTKLKTAFPWSLIKPFFIFLIDDYDGENISLAFDDFQSGKAPKPLEVKNAFKRMKAEMKMREATPLNIPVDKSSRSKQRETLYINSDKEESEKKKTVSKQRFFQQQRNLSYAKAPWMKQFTHKYIKGWVVKENHPFASTHLIKDGWFKVKKEWFNVVMFRQFEDGEVGCLTEDGDIIVETEEMFQQSKIFLLDEISEKSNTPSIFDVAYSMLKTNKVLALMSDSFNRGIVSSFNSETNMKFAEDLSYVLVFLSKLIKDEQIYHSQVLNGNFQPSDLIHLDREILLPEVFKNFNLDHEKATSFISRKREEIEVDFFNFLTRFPTRRKHTTPQRGKPVEYLVVPTREKTPTTISSTIEPEEIKEQQVVKPVELAPDLFKKLRAEITLISPIFCANCNAEIFIPLYRSISGASVVNFCSKECFDLYKFKKC